MKDIIDALHKAYCESSGQEIRLAFDRERYWYEFIQMGFTVEDLQLVCQFLARAVKRGERNPGCLRFRNLIERLDLFEEELQLTKAIMRNFKPVTEKEKTIRAFRPEVSQSVVPMTAKPSKEVVQGAIEELRKAIQ